MQAIWLENPVSGRGSQYSGFTQTSAHSLVQLCINDVIHRESNPQANISLVSLIMAESGVHTLAYAFPRVNIITTAIDPV